MKTGLVTKPEGIRQDIRSFFRLPIPRAVWSIVKPIQNEDFANFVEDSYANGDVRR